MPEKTGIGIIPSDNVLKLQVCHQIGGEMKELVRVNAIGEITILKEITLEEALMAIQYMAKTLAAYQIPPKIVHFVESEKE